MKRVPRTPIVALCAVSLIVLARAAVADDKQKEPVSSVPHAIAIEVIIVETRAVQDERVVGFSGSSEDVAAHVRELESAGKIDVIDRIRLTTLENQEAMVQFGRTTSVASGQMFGGRGGPARTSSQRVSVGMLVSAIGRVEGDVIVVELQTEKSELERREKEPHPDEGVAPRGIETLTSQATVRIDDGKTVLLSGIQSSSGKGSAQRLILVSARILTPPSVAQAAAHAAPRKSKKIRVSRNE
jgi:hypothetical protein